MLARIARMEPALLYPVRHGSEEAQQDLLRIKLRDSLVRARVGLINSLRFTLKSLGYTLANPSTERFHKVIQSALPESVVQMIAPSMQAIEELSLRIKLLDRGDSHSGSHQVSRDDLAGADPRSRPHHCALFRFEDWKIRRALNQYAIPTRETEYNNRPATKEQWQRIRELGGSAADLTYDAAKDLIQDLEIEANDKAWTS